MKKRIRRGDIFCADLNPVTGSEQGEKRPVLIVQNDIGNKYSSTIIIIPITANLEKNPLPTHVHLSADCGLLQDSLALTEQIRTIDISRIGEYICHIDKSTMSKVDKALLICVGVKPEREKALILSLCSRCENDFRNGGYFLVKKGWQKDKTTCDFCNIRNGFVFGVFKGE